LSKMLSSNPARILGLHKGEIALGFDGDLVLVNEKETYVVNPADFAGKSHNTPYAGVTLTGKVKYTLKAGVVTYSDKTEEKIC
ncbi:MAG: amidohydrolase family protein, partial [Ruthenibacterium sp.]